MKIIQNPMNYQNWRAKKQEFFFLKRGKKKIRKKTWKKEFSVPLLSFISLLYGSNLFDLNSSLHSDSHRILQAILGQRLIFKKFSWHFGKEIQLPFNLSIKPLISDFTRSLTMGRQTDRNVDMISLCLKIIPNKCRNDPSQYIIPHNMFSELLCELLHANSSFPGFKSVCHNPSWVWACFLCSLSARNIFPCWIVFHVKYSQSVQQDYVMTIPSEKGKIWFQTSCFFLSVNFFLPFQF